MKIQAIKIMCLKFQKQEFAVNNIQLNVSQKEVENKIGRPKRVTSNEYGTKWYTYYNDDYQNFLMVSYINNKVNALFSNQNIITSKSKIKYNTPKKWLNNVLVSQ